MVPRVWRGTLVRLNRVRRGGWVDILLVFGLAGLMFANWVERVENRHRAATAAFKEAMTSLPDPDNETRVPNDN